METGMKFYLINLIFIFSFFSFAQNKPAEISQFDTNTVSNYHLFNILEKLTPEDYNLLLDSIKNGLSDNYFALRMAYTKTNNYDPYGLEIKNKYTGIENHFDKGQFDEGLKIAEEIIADHYVEAKAHLYAGFAWKMKGNPENEEYQNDIYTNLLNSVFTSGDGRKPETAFISISSEEEYLFLYWVSLNSENQELIYKDNFGFDLIHCEEAETGDKFDVYFNISPALDHLNKSLKK
jgi:hypothetical protein